MTREEAARLLGLKLDGMDTGEVRRAVNSAFERREHDVLERLQKSNALIEQAKYREILDRLALARGALLDSANPPVAPRGLDASVNARRENHLELPDEPRRLPSVEIRATVAHDERSASRDRPTEPPPDRPRRNAARTLKELAALGIAATILIRGAWYFYSRNSRSRADVAIDAATQLVAQQLKAPSTAEYPTRSIVARDDKGDFLVHVVVDAQNTFGAVLRDSFLVAVTVKEADSDLFWYQPDGQAVQSASDPPTTDEILAMERLNGW